MRGRDKSESVLDGKVSVCVGAQQTIIPGSQEDVSPNRIKLTRNRLLLSRDLIRRSSVSVTLLTDSTTLPLLASAQFLPAGTCIFSSRFGFERTWQCVSITFLHFSTLFH